MNDAEMQELLKTYEHILNMLKSVQPGAAVEFIMNIKFDYGKYLEEKHEILTKAKENLK